MGIGRTNVGGGSIKITEVLNVGKWLNNDYKPVVTPPSGVTVTQPTFSAENYAHGLIIRSSGGLVDCSVAFPQALANRKILISFRGSSNGNYNNAYFEFSDGTRVTAAPYNTNDYWEAAFEVKSLTFIVHFNGINTVEFGSIIVIE